MSRFPGKRLLFQQCRATTPTSSSAPLALHLRLFHNGNPFAKSYSRDQQPSLTLSYLVDSCGLSPKAALSAAQQIHIKAKEVPDSVLQLLGDHGFTKTLIAKLVTRYPSILLVDPEEKLKPRIEFFLGVGFSRPDLAKLLTSDSSLLRRTLENQLIPSFDCIRSIVGTNENAVVVVKRSTWVLKCNSKRIILPNISTMREFGVPEHRLLKLMMGFPVVFTHEPNRFREVITAVMGMGFDPLGSKFLIAVNVMLSMSDSNWERKLKVYRSLGCSEGEIHSAFRLQPWCMSLSEKKIRKMADFFVNKMAWDCSFFSKSPQILLFSLEKRIIPRFSVLKVLMSKGLIEKEFNRYTILKLAETAFLKTFVIKYQRDFPEVLTAYQCNTEFVGSDASSKEGGSRWGYTGVGVRMVFPLTFPVELV